MAKDGFNLDAFIKANADYSRGYTFYILVDHAPVKQGDQKFLVRSSTLPASTIAPAMTNWQGNEYKIGTTQEFAEFTVTYSVDVNDAIRSDYLAWVKEVHDPETNVHGDPGKYMTDIQLEHISHINGNTILTYNLVKAWPSNVGEMALDYASKETATFDVTFTYQYHTTK